MNAPFYTCCEEGMQSKVPPERINLGGLCPACQTAQKFKNKPAEQMAAIRRLCLADIDATSDEELRREMLEDGLDPDACAEEVRAAVERTVREFIATHRKPQ